jgi:hypothetical protein
MELHLHTEECINQIRNIVYQSLIIRADEKLCGSLVNDMASSCDCNTNGKRSHDNSKCGGIGCDMCGGKRCMEVSLSSIEQLM